MSIPILVYLFSLDVVVASGYSLFIVGITSLAGAIQRHSTFKIDLRMVFLFGMPSILSIFVTRKWIVGAIPQVIFETPSFAFTQRLLILGTFSLLMIAASVLMIVKKAVQIESAGNVNAFLLILQGMLIGFLSGLVGAGGGFLIVPSLMFLAHISFRAAVGTTLVIISTNSLMGFLGDVLNYQIDWLFLLSISAIAITGVIVGNQCSGFLSSVALKKFFGWFTLIMGIGILLNELFF